MAYFESGDVSAHTEPADIRKIALDIYTAYYNRVDKDNVAFTYGVAENTPDELMLDIVRVTQCIKNLVSNAIKFTQKGCVHLHITYRPMVGLPNDDKNVAQLSIIVIDTGAGISDNKKAKLFQPRTTKPNAIETNVEGIDLSMTRSFARLMGGNLVVKTNPGHGSEFTMHIKTVDVELAALNLLTGYPTFTCVAEFPHGIPSTPGINKEELQIRQQYLQENEIIAHKLQDILPETELPFLQYDNSTNPRNGFSRQKPRLDEILAAPERMDGLNILIVEDIVANQEVMRSLLEPAGCNVGVANHGKEALELMSNQIFDVILMDIRMPIMDGIETTEYIRMHEGPHQDVPIIALTADASAENNAQCLAVGADVFLTKPVILSELFASIRFARQKKLRTFQNTLSA